MSNKTNNINEVLQTINKKVVKLPSGFVIDEGVMKKSVADKNMVFEGIVGMEEYVLYNMYYANETIETVSFPDLVTVGEEACDYTFADCINLVSCDALTATNLGDYCYNSMFNGCTSLTQAPDLPATELAQNCYNDMFKGCSSLETMPNIYATTLAQQCCGGMFEDCTSLKNVVSELPATPLANNCYSGMFKGCTSLIQAPALPATNLARSCYSNMFYGCTSLENMPTLPATTLDDYCYMRMFVGCTKLENVTLPATTLAQQCCDSMFEGCTSLKTASCNFTEIGNNAPVNYMFSNCTALEDVYLPNCTSIAYGGNMLNNTNNVRLHLRTDFEGTPDLGGNNTVYIKDL